MKNILELMASEVSHKELTPELGFRLGRILEPCIEMRKRMK